MDENGNRRRFKSVILPPYMRRSPKVTEVLPLLYLHGLSSGDFVPALEEFFGSEAGLSAATITRLTEQWQIEREHFMNRDLCDRDYVYGELKGDFPASRTCGWTRATAERTRAPTGCARPWAGAWTSSSAQKSPPRKRY